MTSTNTGAFNSGDFNSGNFNSGNFNSGNRNSGYFNSGHFNSGEYNSGHFNRDAPRTIRVFERECPRTAWDRATQPAFFTRFRLQHDGKRVTYKEAWARAWAKREPIDEELLRALPNFDAEIFRDITGIDLTDDGRAEKLERIAALEEELRQLKEEWSQ